MLPYLKLIKLDTLMCIAIAQCCVIYGLFEPLRSSGVDIALNSLGVVSILIATFCIAAAGNLNLELSKHSDFKTLGVSKKVTDLLFVILNIIGVGIGFYISNSIGKPIYTSLFIIGSIGFHIYVTSLQYIFIIRNCIPALLSILAIIGVAVFELLPYLNAQNKSSQMVLFSIVFDYVLFIAVLLIIREIVKDTITINQDKHQHIQTIPIVLGKENTLKLIGGLSILPTLAILYYTYTYLFYNTMIIIAVLIGIIAPLLYIISTSWSITTHLKRLSFILKSILILTSLVLLLYSSTLS